MCKTVLRGSHEVNSTRLGLILSVSFHSLFFPPLPIYSWHQVRCDVRPLPSYGTKGQRSAKAQTRRDLIFKGKQRIPFCFPRDWINYNSLFQSISENSHVPWNSDWNVWPYVYMWMHQYKYSNIIFFSPPPPTHQKKMRRMLAMSSTRQTRVEKPSQLLLLWMSWYCGTYGRAPPKTMRQDASQDSNVHVPPMSSPWSTTSESMAEAQRCPDVALGKQQSCSCTVGM